MTAPDEVKRLADKFDQNKEQYTSAAYNEMQLRQEFLDPLFAELGWDMENRAGVAEPYKEVIHEDSIKIGGETKAPDYAFRIGKERKFFLEAKKPSVNIRVDATPAFQLRRYAWSAKLPLSILSDFQEFAVYDCRVKPAKTDKAAAARINFFSYQDYVPKWDEISSVFSRDAVWHGSFDKYVIDTKTKKGTDEVDDAFLKEIEGWRDSLARNIALRNPRLTVHELNFAVQRTIDRIIFLRICEDRGIENYGALRAFVNGERAYKRMCEHFYRADERYNSGLFHFSNEKGRPEIPDELTLGLQIDDKILKDIIGSLYYPDCSYEFSVLPADILGQVYEQFLGKVIRLTTGHQAKVEEKPEVKKAGGVYYTPTFVVDYIAKHTVGKILDGEMPKQASQLRILDPACGSGSFLIGAYQYLLDWHYEWYTHDGAAKWSAGKNATLYAGPAGDWRLTTAERKRILLNNIYGVDIDSQAVEVTKLSLLLKVLEGESEESINQQLKMFHERALPDLGENIKCGNSLIGHDFFEGHLIVDPNDRDRINAFDWSLEFKSIIEEGGFHAVIGNPPYGMIGYESAKPYYAEHYCTLEGRYDLYELFVEQGLRLLRRAGRLGYIIPSPFLTNVYTRRLRQYVLKESKLIEICNFGMEVFADPTVHSCIVVMEKGHSEENRVAIRKQVKSPAELNVEPDYAVDQTSMGSNDNFTFDIFVDSASSKILQKLATGSRSLGDLCHIRQCIKTGDDSTYVRTSQTRLKSPWKPSLRGKSIERYHTLETDLYVRYGEWLARNWKNTSFYEVPKIAIRETGKKVIAVLDLENRFFLSSLYSIYPKSQNEQHALSYLLGILNSRLASYYLHIIAYGLTEGAFTKIRTNQLSRLPIRLIDFSNPADTSKHSRMTNLVESIISLNRELTLATTDQKNRMLQREITSTDAQIDALVYDLYGLTEEEIAIVEGKSI